MAHPVYSDAARRCADVVNLHAYADPESTGHFVAIRLSDGGSDGALYDTREQAVSHQLHPEWCTYVQIHPGGMTPQEAEAVLRYWRALSDACVRPDDQSSAGILMPLTSRDQLRHIKVLAKGRS